MAKKVGTYIPIYKFDTVYSTVTSGDPADPITVEDVLRKLYATILDQGGIRDDDGAL